MALDFAAIATIGRDTVEQLLVTSGTTMTWARETAVAVVDPDTLAPTAGTVTAVTRAVPAIVLPTSSGVQGDPFPGVDRRQVPHTILLSVHVTAVREGDVGTITRAVDRAMVGRRYRVTAVSAGSAGAARVLGAVAVPRTGGLP